MFLQSFSNAAITKLLTSLVGLSFLKASSRVVYSPLCAQESHKFYKHLIIM